LNVNYPAPLDLLPILEAMPSSTEQCSDPQPARRLPPWLKREIPRGNANHFTANLLEELRLETVCDNARCPNRMECYSQKTATFMILGNVCTTSRSDWPKQRIAWGLSMS
jgi:lipoyl synthase